MARTHNQAGAWCKVFDSEYRVAYFSDEGRLTYGGLTGMVPVPLGAFIFGTEYVDAMLSWPGAVWGIGGARELFTAMGPWVLADTPGGREELREKVDSRLQDLVDGLQPAKGSTAITFGLSGFAPGAKAPFEVKHHAMRIRDEDGRFIGVVMQLKPAVGMSTIGAIASIGDLGHFERMQRVANAGRRPAAILFADLEGSSSLARRLSTASYFALGRRLVRAADQCVVDAGGLVGRHVGDGVVAFFLVETAGSDSTAARNCISAARALREAVDEVAARSELQPADVVLRFGLHWGSSLYVGNISTAGRSEVTALGDEVNEAARVEACASGGRALASKDLMERLDPDDAAALDIDPARATYTPLGELTTATEKARRDAPTIPVCEV
ncbi:MAG TPA: adenylate/guanylate cyclase domain-containing protein [Solirubrobacterales bacterium]